jgi:retron-type reverse transcriptase
LGTLYRKLQSVKRLRKAWSVVYKNGISSKSKITKKEIEEFSVLSETHLSRISNQLRKFKFKFSLSHGVAIPKPNKPNKKRPIVVSPVENKILQRAILDVIQEIPEVADKLISRFNFGGVPEVAVPEAVKKAYLTSLEKPYFIRTDIKAFFDNIPRPKALKIINDSIDDIEFQDILKRATNTELDNLATLGRDTELFPLEDKGVAQGSCLSPMICNLLLHNFDLQMNGRGIVCIRYIDDFILFAKDEATAFKAFNSAKKLLQNLGLTVYDPRTDSDKAEMGISRKGFEFLGCNIREDRIRPASKSQERLKLRVTEVLKNGLNALKNPKKAIEEGKTYRDTLYEVNNVIRGWGNSYAFCTDDNLMANLDKAIDSKLQSFNSIYKAKVNKLSSSDKRRLMGVYLLEDCKKEDEAKNDTLRYAVKQENEKLKKK